ncbi:MAG: hypothetical protein SWY16_15515 [Cyanobacteriota bacterium]|nr:hypothetical protein [Cyanobacteriota bacterium]
MPYQPNSPEYSQMLYPWAIARQLPNLQNAIVGRFRSQSDAEGHLRCLRRLVPTARFIVFFDLPSTATVPEFPHCEIRLHSVSIG